MCMILIPITMINKSVGIPEVILGCFFPQIGIQNDITGIQKIYSEEILRKFLKL